MNQGEEEKGEQRSCIYGLFPIAKNPLLLSSASAVRPLILLEMQDPRMMRLEEASNQRSRKKRTLNQMASACFSDEDRD